ncbi:MAG: polya polymerase [Eubacteriales bacterium]|nr:polya polymerase [Eubacteriales bacterium]
MKINKINNVNKFFKLIDNLTGEAFLINKEGKLNLKSKLSQFIIVAKCLNDDLGEVEILFDNPEDEEHMKEFLVHDIDG